MKLIIKKELTFSDNGIYIFETRVGHFFINKNLQDILTLDENLNIINSFKINQSIGIHIALCSEDGNKLLLYCPDDEELLTYCDIFNDKVFTINTNVFKASSLSPLCYWGDDKILLSSYDKHFYQLDYATQQLNEINQDFVSINYPIFLDFWQAVEQYGFGYQINSQQLSFIYNDETNKKIVFFDYKNNKKTVAQHQETGYHDIVFCNGYFIFVAEKLLTIVKGNDVYQYPMKHPLYIFLRVRCIIENGKLCVVALTGNNSNQVISKLTKYELTA